MTISSGPTTQTGCSSAWDGTLRLNPAQDGPPLNYFVYPYVEVSGKEHPNVSLAFSFADVDAGNAAAK